MKKTYQHPTITVIGMQTEGIMKQTSIFNQYNKDLHVNFNDEATDHTTINTNPNLEVDVDENHWGWDTDF